jgi:hypothetical protein
LGIFALLLAPLALLLNSSCVVVVHFSCIVVWFFLLLFRFPHTATLVLLLLFGSSYFCLAAPSLGTFSSHVCYLFPFVLPFWLLLL